MSDTWMILIITGFSAGLLGGLLGIGGGVVLMPVLRFVVGLSPTMAAGTTVVAVFCTTLGGGLKHYRLGHVPLRDLRPVIITGALSTFLFSILFLRLAQKEQWLDFSIGCVFMLLALRIIWDSWRSARPDPESASACKSIQGSRAGKMTLGFLAGVLPGLFGIGTGAVLVPGFRYFLKSPVKIAIGSALVCFCANALISAVMKYTQGYVNPGLVLPVCLGCLISSQLGAVINNRAPSRLLMLLFGLIFLWVAVGFILSGLRGS